MSFHYSGNRVKTAKRRFITLSNSYHGEYPGALGVAAVQLCMSTYQPLLLHVITVPSPDCYVRQPGVLWAAYSRRKFVLFQQARPQSARDPAAVVIEPLA